MKHIKKGKKTMIIISCIVITIIAVIAGRIFFLTSATTGKPIANYSIGKAALIVIDIQEDTLSIPQYKNADELIQNINTSIKYADENGIDIIYIKQENSSILDLILTGGMYKENTNGVSLSSQLLIKSDNVFSKLRNDAFSQEVFEQYLIEKQINTLYIVGADASACVYKTSLGGVNRGYNVVILKDCIFSINDNTLSKMMKKYEEAGINVKEMNDFLQSSNNINE